MDSTRPVGSSESSTFVGTTFALGSYSMDSEGFEQMDLIDSILKVLLKLVVSLSA
jgi:hypothetical protein